MNALLSAGLKISGINLSDKTERVEIPNPEKRKPGRHPQKGWTPTIWIDKPAGEADVSHVEIHGTASQFEEFWKTSRGSKLNLSDNHKWIEDLHGSGRTHFAGGTSEELTAALSGNGKMDAYYSARARIESAQWVEDLRRHLAQAMPVRRKKYGEDGEYDRDRRWEPFRYVDRPAMPSPLTTLEILMDCTCSYDVQADQIAEYCATVWALTDLLEAQGLSVGLTLRYWSNAIMSENKTSKIHVRIKNPGEYLSPSFVAGFMSPNFYRRCIFLARAFVSDYAGKPVSYSMGQPKSFPCQAEWNDGVLRLSFGVIYAAHQIPEAFSVAVNQANSAA